ncbi:EsaB/YukD family protein [Mycolicibacterium fortuitum]|nr:EsaB/YukD family protein [Mycolicibacterium fortuitum]
MPDSLRHVSIHCGASDEEGHGATVDLSLPAAMTVGELLPWIVDALDAGHGHPRRWQLAHVGDRVSTSRQPWCRTMFTTAICWCWPG